MQTTLSRLHKELSQLVIVAILQHPLHPDAVILVLIGQILDANIDKLTYLRNIFPCSSELLRGVIRQVNVLESFEKYLLRHPPVSTTQVKCFLE